MFKPKFRIYYKELDDNGNEIRRGIDDKEYVNYGSAINRGRKLYGDRTRFIYDVAWRDPWIEYTEPTTCKCCGKSYERPVTHDMCNKGHHIYLTNISTVPLSPARHFRGYICSDCYEKINSFIGSLTEGEKML